MKNSKNSHPYELMDYDDSSVSSKQPLFAHTHPAEPDEYTFRLSTTTSETTSPTDHPYSYTGLMGSLVVLEEGHIYSLAAAGDLLFTGSDSKNIRVRKNQKEFSGFKSNSGLVKAIIIADERIFSGHQDGKIRVWKMSNKDPSVYKLIGTLMTLKAKVKKSFKPRNSSFSFCKSPVFIILKLFCVFHFVDFFFL